MKRIFQVCIVLIRFSFLFTALGSGFAQSVPIPAGTVSLGGGQGDPDEIPVRTVSLAAFSMDRYEVTRSQYDSCVAAGACSPIHDADGLCIKWSNGTIVKVSVPQAYRKPEYPAVCITWAQARDYCRYKGKRLPTEAEWEYAALAKSANIYSWGNQPPSASYTVSSSIHHPVKPGSFPANAWGLSDMTGNVWEWTSDTYLANRYTDTMITGDAVPSVGRYKTIRGGGWYSNAEQLRIKNRQWFVPEYGEISIGARCVK